MNPAQVSASNTTPVQTPMTEVEVRLTAVLRTPEGRRRLGEALYRLIQERAQQPKIAAGA